MHIDLTFALDPTSAFDPTSTSSLSSSSNPSSSLGTGFISGLAHAYVNADVSTNVHVTTFSIGRSKWKRCIDISTNLQS
jgi:hypothetical protein